jgi:hypothetical protein
VLRVNEGPSPLKRILGRKGRKMLKRKVLVIPCATFFHSFFSNDTFFHSMRVQLLNLVV